ncbi:MAG TPA: hypothetical protein VIR57_12240 [Chloroflexota bacterium]|jgi:hypothetical protein
MTIMQAVTSHVLIESELTQQLTELVKVNVGVRPTDHEFLKELAALLTPYM